MAKRSTGTIDGLETFAPRMFLVVRLLQQGFFDLPAAGVGEARFPAADIQPAEGRFHLCRERIRLSPVVNVWLIMGPP